MTPTEWLLGRDTGISSRTIFAVMTGSKITDRFGADVPHDPADFGRCYRLLSLFPDWRKRLPEVAAMYPMWGPMVNAWNELTELYIEEKDRPDGRAQKLYDRMQTLLDEGRIADGWVRTSSCSWKKTRVSI